MLMGYSIGKQRSPFGFQSHPKYSRNKHRFQKNVITAKFGSMSDPITQILHPPCANPSHHSKCSNAQCHSRGAFFGLFGCELSLKLSTIPAAH